MTGLSIFLLGTVALTNVAVVAYLFADKSKSVKPPDVTPNQQREPEQPIQNTPVSTAPEIQSNAMVGSSKFDVDDFLRKFENLEKGVYKINETLERLEGEVKLKDVEFTNSEDVPTPEEIESDSAEVDNSTSESRNLRMSKEEESKAFEDVRIDEVDSETVSAPSASGASIDEIENDVNTALNENAPARDRVRASAKLLNLLDTNLFDALASNEKMLKGLQSYIRQAMKADMSDSTTPSKEDKPKVKIKTKDTASKQAFKVSNKVADFNPADLIPK